MNAKQAKAVIDVLDVIKNDIEERIFDVLEESIDDEEELHDEYNEVCLKLKKLYEDMDSFWSVLRDMLPNDEEKKRFDNL